MIVVDTCIIVYLFNESDFTLQASHILDIDSEWIFPPIWREEYANVIVKMAKSQNVSEAAVLNHFQKTIDQLEPNERSIDIIDAIKTAFKMNISVYDAHFVSLAKEMEAILITEDRELIKKCPGIAISMKEFVNNYA